MATPRPYTAYPYEYTELFTKAVSEAVKVELPSVGEAKRLRGQLYAFRTSLAVPNCGAAPNLIATAPLVSFKLTGSTLTVYRPVRSNKIAKVLKDVTAS